MSRDFWSTHSASAAFHPANRYRYSLILSELRSLSTAGVLVDVGCGNGELLGRVRTKCPSFQLVGCDESSLIIRTNREEKGFRFVVADASDATFIDSMRAENIGNVDVITLTEVVEHVEDDYQLISNCERLLKRGGWLLLTTQGGPRYRMDRVVLGHIRHYRRRDLIAMLQRLGFGIRKSYCCGFPVLSLQKVGVELMFSRVQREVLERHAKPAAWVRCIMTLMYWLMLMSPRGLGPQIVIVAQKL